MQHFATLRKDTEVAAQLDSRLRLLITQYESRRPLYSRATIMNRTIILATTLGLTFCDHPRRRRAQAAQAPLPRRQRPSQAGRSASATGPALAPRKIDVAYTDKVDALSAKNLAGYDGLIVYANIDKITPEQEKALLDLRRRRQGLHSAALRVVLLPATRRSTSPWSAPSSSATAPATFRDARSPSRTIRS